LILLSTSALGERLYDRLDGGKRVLAASEYVRQSSSGVDRVAIGHFCQGAGHCFRSLDFLARRIREGNARERHNQRQDADEASQHVHLRDPTLKDTLEAPDRVHVVFMHSTRKGIFLTQICYIAFA
jgi:hypothetical protein